MAAKKTTRQAKPSTVEDRETPVTGPKTVADDSKFPVVGLGASAGGLQAFSDFLRAMPINSGMAFVMIHHVNPDHESLMAEILSKHTAMPVVLAEDGMGVEPNHVYVIPPNCDLELQDGKLRLSQPSDERGRRQPINRFLKSLARDCGANSIAAILSGTGSDGSATIADINNSGGLVLIQDPYEAAHDGMPRSAIATGFGDYVVSVSEMPDIMTNFAQHPFLTPGPRKKVLGETAQNSLQEIIAALKAHSPVRFDMYKSGTLLRRIERRMALRHMQSAADYLALIKHSPEEAESLCRDFLISVTSFFRDPDAFEHLNTAVLDDLVRRRPSAQPVRVWVPACASGEEAYTLAMLLIERVSTARKDVKVQVFASDVDDLALGIARDGLYSDAIENHVSEGRLSRFFVKDDQGYRVSSELRDSVVFAKQNILSDAPFSKLDLISCRNLMIYLTPQAQDRILQVSHFALNDDGVLFLGPSETVTENKTLFRPLSRKHRIYSRIGGEQPRRTFTLPASVPRSGGALSVHALTMSSASRLADTCQRLLVERFAPAAALVDASNDAVYLEGPTDQFLKVPSGEVSRDILAMARNGLRAQLASSLRKARLDDAEINCTATITRDGASVTVLIQVLPVMIDGNRLFLVTFRDRPKPSTAVDRKNGDDAIIRNYERELETARADLHLTSREYERSTEELKAANEEAMSMNEEFMSTNEELETSKEELQSLNEELTTLNAQLQHKIEAEHRLSDDLNNLLSSSGIATLFLNRERMIMRFTPTTRELFNLISNDVGRPFGDITSRIDDPALFDDIDKVLASLQTAEAEVKADSGKWFIRRVLPYRLQDGKIDGVVLTFAEVSALKELQHTSQAAQKYAESIVNTVHGPLLVLDGDMRIVSVNPQFHHAFGTSDGGIVGKNLFSISGNQWEVPDLRRLLTRLLPESESVEAFNLSIAAVNSEPREFLLNARRLLTGPDKDDLILLAMDDITEERQSQQALIDREARLRAILDAVPEGVIAFDEIGNITSFSPSAEKILGYSQDEIIGKSTAILVQRQFWTEQNLTIADYIQNRMIDEIGTGRDDTFLRKDGSAVPIHIKVSEMKVDGKRQFTGILRDLTEENRRRAQLEQAQKMEAVGQLTGGIAHDFNNLLTVVIGNLELLEMRSDAADVQELIQEALEAANLGSVLTGQLLAFSKRQPLTPEILCLPRLVAAISPLLKRALGELIAIRTELKDDLDQVLADPGQIESALLNMAINARDAMPDGGTLTIEAHNILVETEGNDPEIDLQPGKYVVLSVIDSGTGIAPDVKEKVFTPFYSTKGPGQGSGLGLSMVYGFAKQSGGTVKLASVLGQGTKVDLYLPSAGDSDPVGKTKPDRKIDAAAHETVLVVEDNPSVRRLTRSRLEFLGYSVLDAENGLAALDMLEHSDDIDLMLSDIVMPGKPTGIELAAQVRAKYPDVAIVLASGYPREADTKGTGASKEEFKVLRKPYTLQYLARVLRDTLD